MSDAGWAWNHIKLWLRGYQFINYGTGAKSFDKALEGVTLLAKVTGKKHIHVHYTDARWELWLR